MSNRPVILFDGVCNLCNGFVQFVIKHDSRKLFQFASLQSDFGQQILSSFQLDACKEFQSFILLNNGNIYTKSTAALKVLTQLDGYGWTKLFFVIPKFLRDFIYSIIAVNRYKWFGKKDTCMIPTPELKDRFIEST